MGTTNRRTVLKASALGAGFMSLSGCFGDEDETTTLRLAHPVPASAEPIGPFCDDFAERTEANTNGSVVVEVFPSSELGGSVEQAEGVSEGTIAMMANAQSLLDPFFDVVAFPYLYEDYDEFREKTDIRTSQPLQEINQRSIDEHNFRAVTYMPTGHRTVQMKGEEEVCRPEDLEGVKLRTPETPYFTTATEGIGAEPVPIDTSEIGSALSTGSIDGLELYAGLTEVLGLFDQLDQIAVTNHSKFPMALGINEGIFQDLTEDEQQGLSDAAYDAREDKLEEIDELEAAVYDRASEEGLIISDANGCLELDVFKEQCQAKMFEEFPEWEEWVEAIREV